MGCYDDGDGYRDENEPVNLRGNPTQWRDSDFDGFGDNWGNPEWNATRDSSWPGEFVPGATNADYCPKTTPGLQVDEEGCHISQRDSDQDGVMDDADNCPNDPRGVDGYDDGCPYVPLAGDGEEGLFGVDAGVLMLALGGVGALLVIGIVVARILRRDDDDDEEYDEDDFFDDDDEEENILDILDRNKTTGLQRPRASPQPAARTSPPMRQRGPTGPPKKGPGGPPKQAARTVQRQPSKASKKPVEPKKAGKKKISSEPDESGGAKVRRAKINVDMSIFEDWQEDDRNDAVEWVVGAFSDGEQERKVLMQLQETGWTAEQSRAICSLAKNWRD